MNVTETKKIIAAAALADDTVIMEAVHGVGKSAIVKQYAKEAGLHVEEIFLSLMEPADLCGIPRSKEVGGQFSTIWDAPTMFNNIINRAYPYELDMAHLKFEDPEFESYVKENM